MPPRRKKQNSAIIFDPSAPVQTQMESLHRAIEQIMGQAQVNENVINKKKSDGTGFGHTTAMPDSTGVNTDHDLRYSNLVHGHDHGSDLSGLGDDDHTQYLLADGTRPVTGDLTVNTGNIILDTLKWIGLGIASGRIVFTEVGTTDSIAVRDSKFNIGDGTNQTVFEKDGTMRFEGTATVWNDIQFSIATAKVPAANAPTWTAFVGNLKKFTFDIDDYVDLEAQELSHGYKEGSDAEWHIHIYTNGVDGTDRTCKVQIEYSITNINGVCSVSTVNKEITIPANTADRTHLYIDVADVVGTTFKFAADISAQFKRIASSGTEPTADPFVSMVGFHIEQDSVGSFDEQSKQLKTWVLTDARSWVTLGLINPTAETYAAGLSSSGMWDAQDI